jgi:NitT/TauT family transport system substrate-binding protein
VHPWIGYETLYLAEEFGWLPPTVQLSKGQTSRDSMHGILAGELDAAALTLDEVLRIQAGDVPVKVVAVADVSVGADMVMVRPEIDRLEALAGQSIGVDLAGVAGIMLFAVLERAGLRSDQVSIVNIPVNQHLEAWNEGAIDVSVCYQPTASRLGNAGAVRLFDSSQMPDTIFDVLVVTEKAERKQPSAVEDLVRGHFLGLRHLVRNMHDAVYRIATRQQITPETVREAMATVMLPELTANRRYLSPGGRVEIVAHRLGNILVREGLIEQSPDIANLCTRDYLPGSLS